MLGTEANLFVIVSQKRNPLKGLPVSRLVHIGLYLVFRSKLYINATTTIIERFSYKWINLSCYFLKYCYTSLVLLSTPVLWQSGYRLWHLKH